ncbi:hypothetical protein MTR_3g013450 [Medicago truncatula]|uniref:Uncharacterized protein n=1 Tax=Medicago truncatula TaxID=3880 RepID=G7IVT7_MEDTR|nr:hypothetical protein MTR_3g013450 [Medicago truncatula]
MFMSLLAVSVVSVLKIRPISSFRNNSRLPHRKLSNHRKTRRSSSSTFQIMDTQKNQAEKPTSSAAVATSCRKKKHEEASFLEDVKDHIDEFINASMDEHKTCFQKTIKKMFGLSKVVAEANSKATKEVESSLPLQTVLKE